MTKLMNKIPTLADFRQKSFCPSHKLSRRWNKIIENIYYQYVDTSSIEVLHLYFDYDTMWTSNGDRFREINRERPGELPYLSPHNHSFLSHIPGPY